MLRENVKKLSAILILTVHLFNLAGYSFLFQYFIKQSDKQIVQQLDNNQYSDKDLVEVKVPLNVPYITNWKDYERYDGEIEWNGIHYNYVKRKVSNDTLYLMCIQNEKKTQLYEEKNNFQRMLTDIPSKKNNDTNVKKACVCAEYNLPNHYSFAVDNFSSDYERPFSCEMPTHIFLKLSDKPPRIYC